MDTIEDLKAELGVLAEFLSNGFFDNSGDELRTNLLVELVVMKLRAMGEK